MDYCRYTENKANVKKKEKNFHQNCTKRNYHGIYVSWFTIGNDMTKNVVPMLE